MSVISFLRRIYRKSPFFHAQQAIEKSLKAVLFARGEEFRKTHDLYELADRLEKAGIFPPSNADVLAQINPYAVEFRYGDEVISTLSSEEVDAIATQMLDWAAAIIAGMEP